MSSLEEIDKIVTFIKKRTSRFVLMNCTSLYPCPYDKINLGLINSLKQNIIY